MSTGKYRQHKSDMQVVPAHVRLVQREVQAYLATSGTTQRLRSLGLEPAALCGEGFAARIDREVAGYSQIAQALGFTAD